MLKSLGPALHCPILQLDAYKTPILDPFFQIKSIYDMQTETMFQKLAVCW